MFSLAPSARAGVEGRIETTNLRVFFIFLQSSGLDTAGERRLLDQQFYLIIPSKIRIDQI